MSTDTTPVYAERSFLVEWFQDPDHHPGPASSYGAKIPTRTRVRCADGRTRRVWAMVWGSLGSTYIIVEGERRFLHDSYYPA